MGKTDENNNTERGSGMTIFNSPELHSPSTSGCVAINLLNLLKSVHSFNYSK